MRVTLANGRELDVARWEGAFLITAGTSGEHLEHAPNPDADALDGRHRELVLHLTQTEARELGRALLAVASS